MSAQEPSKILIVDDLPENRQALEALLRHDPRVIHQASSGDAALALLLEHEFALAILDVQMPGMNGFELAEVMRSTSSAVKPGARCWRSSAAGKSRKRCCAS